MCANVSIVWKEAKFKIVFVFFSFASLSQTRSVRMCYVHVQSWSFNRVLQECLSAPEFLTGGRVVPYKHPGYWIFVFDFYAITISQNFWKNFQIFLKKISVYVLLHWSSLECNIDLKMQESVCCLKNKVSVGYFYPNWISKTKCGQNFQLEKRL